MSKLETPMILAYWETVGGTLIEEFQLVKGDPSCGPRRADAVILPNRNRDQLGRGRRAVSIEGEDVIVVHAKAYRLGMYWMGQAIFSAERDGTIRPAEVARHAKCKGEGIRGNRLRIDPLVEPRDG